MIQLPLLDWQPPPQIFGDRDGVTFNRTRDGKRLNDQAQRVWNAMAGGEWLGLQEIHDIILTTTGHDDPLQSIGARARDFRKEKFGGYDVQREYVGKGLWKYRVLT